ncbi:MAG: CoA transferase [Actinobacteria bacterium]|nr:CoA transferase [Actinomycetota bacterium]
MTAGFTPLAGIRVLDFSTQIAGAYCSKLLADAGAEVVKVEASGGDPLRRWSATGADLGGGDSALFCFLHAGKQSVVGTAADPHVARLIAESDLVIEAHGLAYETGERLDADALRAAHPALVVLSITPYGRTGPWTERAATDLTLQAEAGSLGLRGLLGGEPFQAGGRITEWAGGAYGAAAALPAVLHAQRSGRGEHVDLSLLETANLVFTNNSETMNRLMNGGPSDPDHAFLAPGIETPSIEPTADGYVGFCTNARKQFEDFLRLVGRPDLLDDAELIAPAGRIMRFAEWNEIVRGWCGARTTAEVIERASELRIPVSPVANGRTVLEDAHLVARGCFGSDASDRFRRPRPPYRIDDADLPAPRPAPRLDPEARPAFSGPRPARRDRDPGALPLAGLRVLDLAAWWAGPAATHLLACMGADVVHVESLRRPDGLRSIGGMMVGSYPQHWEASPHFLQCNADKRDVTLDLHDPAGLALVERLIEWCDVVVENFTPRVMDDLGLTWDRVRVLNPRAVYVRMPAFGLSGPWRDRPGFAQTVEQFSGLAWVTGHPDDQPRIPRGPCDPIAGMHGAVAILAALEQRERTGRGHLVESTLAEAALNIAAEPVIEWTAYGRLIERAGNRSPHAAPQGLYPCADADTPTAPWLALSVVTDEHWRALRSILGDPEWAADPALDSHAGRSAAHDTIDGHLRSWTRTQSRAGLVDRLRAGGIPASAVADPCRLLQTNPQLQARGYFETPTHPVVGSMPMASMPFRYASIDRWFRTPAPTLGQHNEEVLGGILGLSAAELAELTRAGAIGTRTA